MRLESFDTEQIPLLLTSAFRDISHLCQRWSRSHPTSHRAVSVGTSPRYCVPSPHQTEKPQPPTTAGRANFRERRSVDSRPLHDIWHLHWPHCSATVTGVFILSFNTCLFIRCYDFFRLFLYPCITYFFVVFNVLMMPVFFYFYYLLQLLNSYIFKKSSYIIWD